MAMDFIIATREMSTHAPANTQVRNGVTSGAKSVVVIVMATDSATSPFARYVITFDAVPPGQVPTSTTPMAISGGSAKSLTSAQAISGINVNCASAPTPTSHGRFASMWKSSNRSVIPMPNITTPSIHGT